MFDSDHKDIETRIPLSLLKDIGFKLSSFSDGEVDRLAETNNNKEIEPPVKTGERIENSDWRKVGLSKNSDMMSAYLDAQHRNGR